MGPVGYLNIGQNGFATNSGTITIDRISSADPGIQTIAIDISSSFTNTGTIILGALGPIGPTAISCTSNNFTNSGCGALVDIQADAVITTTHSLNRFSNINGATIVERASGTSTIYNNSGLIRNLNGGTFTIANTNTGLLSTTPGITANPSLTITEGQSTTLTAEGDGPYTWSTTETTQSIEVTTSGPYSVTNSIVGLFAGFQCDRHRQSCTTHADGFSRQSGNGLSG
jgi:hypothetical protein